MTLVGIVSVPSHWWAKVHVSEGAGIATNVVLVSPVSLVKSKRFLSSLRTDTNVGSVCQPRNCAAWLLLHHQVIQGTLNSKYCLKASRPASHPHRLTCMQASKLSTVWRLSSPIWKVSLQVPV